jgi:hypothetical protein
MKHFHLYCAGSRFSSWVLFWRQLCRMVTSLHSHKVITSDKPNFNVTYAPSPASRSSGCWLSLTPVTIVKRTSASWHSPRLHHLLDYLPYICHSPWYFPQVLLTLFHVGELCFVFLLFIKTLTPWTCFPTLSAFVTLNLKLRRKSTFFFINVYIANFHFAACPSCGNRSVLPLGQDPWQ